MIEFVMPDHTSHSAISSYLRCQKAYELGKLGFTEAPAWWLLGGSAVHKATEWWDNGEWDEAPELAFYKAFQDEIVQAEQSHPNHDGWRKAGYGARAQGYEHWMKQGPLYVKQWADRDFDGDLKWVELDVSTTLPSGLEIKAYIDRVSVSRENLTIDLVDMKTGSTRPDSDQQLGIYKTLLIEYLKYKHDLLYVGEFDIHAYNYMFKDDEFYEMDVSNWTLDTVDKMAQEWYRGLESGVFLPNRGKQCGTCGVASACFLQSGETETTRRYDRLNPNYEG
jgi:CRISPR/Cas system-associated exonuclease Cas4 (RecB family)